MAVVRGIVLLLLVALGSHAALAEDECEAFTKKLPSSDLDKVFGEWVLLWAVSDYPAGSVLVANVSSSHTELKLHADNKTVIYNERNQYTDNSCSTYYINSTVDSNSTLTMQTVSATVEKNGVQSVYNDSARLDFYQSCSDCLVMVYRGKNSGGFLMNYRRDGSNWNDTKLNAAEKEFNKRIECLNFKAETRFSYDGVAEFCHKRQAADVKPEES